MASSVKVLRYTASDIHVTQLLQYLEMDSECLRQDPQEFLPVTWQASIMEDSQ